ncbi:MAG: single-stranded-DNA-specific exonuclease RecJ [Deinococcales bacterium]
MPATSIPLSRVRPVDWGLRLPSPLAPLEEMSRTLGISPKIAAVLYGRGIHSTHALEPAFALSPNPALLEAATQIKRAIEQKKRIRIHGDYDADGVTAAALLSLGLNELGANSHTFIPHRILDGYGINPERVPEHIEACDLLITVDCGVSNLDEIRSITQAGIDTIVTDHHAPGQILPRCLVVHPALAPNYHHDLPALTGSGVAFHLLWAVRREFGAPPPLEYADLAAIGTIADLAPLLGENRALVKVGLEQMKNSRWTGIRAMLEQKKISAPSAQDVGFIIAPRINAAGRLGEAEAALELLTTNSANRALTLATYLDARNLERKRIQEDMFAEAMQIADPEAPALVVTKEGWHPGVMGIVASKLLEQFYKPVFIIAEGKGSVRSTPGISAVLALRHAHETLKRYGGHSQAGGFAIYNENIPAFSDKILEFTRTHPDPREKVYADALLQPSEVSRELMDQLLSLEPFGQGHLPPLFWLRETLEQTGALGQEGKHFQYRVAGIKGKQWGVGVPFMAGDAIDAAVTLEDNVFNGRSSLEFTTQKMRYQSRLKVLEPDEGAVYPRLNAKTELERLKLEPSPIFASAAAADFIARRYPELSLELPEALQSVTLFSLPPAARLQQWLEAGVALRFAFTEKTLGDLENVPYFTLENLRFFEQQRRGTAIPPAAKSLLEQVRGLSTLECYQTSPALRQHELEVYRYKSFVRFYRLADDAGFSSAVRRLFASHSIG